MRGFRAVNGFRTVNGFRAVLSILLIGLGVAACTSGGRVTTTPTSALRSSATPTTDPSNLRVLATLPARGAPVGGPGYAVIVSARGKGSRKLGTFTILKGGGLIIQAVCYDPGNLGTTELLTISPLSRIGPCASGQNVMTITTTAGTSELTLAVRTKPGMLWAVYVVAQLVSTSSPS